VILRALPDLLAVDAGLVFVWAGDGPLREQLTGAVSATGLGQHVRLLGRREDIPELLAAADLFLMPSRDEGGAPPFALAEAMLAGVPAVVSDIGALSEVVEDGRNGLLFTGGDPDELVRVIGRALADRDRLSEMASSAREQALREFTVERMTEELLAYVLPPLSSGAEHGS
jgi:glycosyltransferase involved in cell wall biosynthesis